MSSTTDEPVLFGPPPGAAGPERAGLLETLQPFCLRHALALAGTDALRLHGLTTARPGAVVLVCTEGPPLADLATGLAETLRAAGHPVQEQPGTARRITLTGTRWPVELRKEPLRHAPVLLGAPVPVVALEDAAGLAVLAFCDRGLPGDLATLHSLTRRTGRLAEGALLALAAGLDEDFSTRQLADRLDTATARLNDERVQAWAEQWSQDLRLDLLETTELPDGLHDPYLEEEEENAAPAEESSERDRPYDL
ncbi:hypothetical protein ACGFX4_29905 [Kitasatospora sp. NPDC048365]|uniref:hypothetical protein n=1 Tax=Kitasatospora sp. NPDC048365 TaxID=3364050 RepID=UPI00371FA80B